MNADRHPTSMRLTVIGAGPAYSDDPGSRGACYLLEAGPDNGEGGVMAMDLGHGAFASLASRVAPERLAAVLVSHLHPDHFVDLVPLRHWLRYHVAPPARIAVHAHVDLFARLDGLHGQAGFADGSLDLVPLSAGARSVGPFEVIVASVRHTADSFAFRLHDGSASGVGLVYSGDVGEADDLAPLIRPDDVLLVECSFGAGPVPMGAAHLDGPAVGALAAATRPSSVLLTHILPGVDVDAAIAAVRAAFDGPVAVVHPGFSATI